MKLLEQHGLVIPVEIFSDPKPVHITRGKTFRIGKHWEPEEAHYGEGWPAIDLKGTKTCGSIALGSEWNRETFRLIIECDRCGIRYEERRSYPWIEERFADSWSRWLIAGAQLDHKQDLVECPYVKLGVNYRPCFYTGIFTRVPEGNDLPVMLALLMDDYNKAGFAALAFAHQMSRTSGITLGASKEVAALRGF